MTHCDRIIKLEVSKTTSNSFRDWVEMNCEETLIMYSIETIGLQLIQLLPGFKRIDAQGGIIHFIKKDQFGKLTNQEYFEEVYRSAKREESIVKKRTRASIKKVRERGVKVGRPAINQELITEIR